MGGGNGGCGGGAGGSPESDDDDEPPQQKKTLKRQLTKHVVTRWYRAPELILLQVRAGGTRGGLGVGMVGEGDGDERGGEGMKESFVLYVHPCCNEQKMGFDAFGNQALLSLWDHCCPWYLM